MVIEKEKTSLSSRAWIEINVENLIYNIKQIENIISKDTKIMAVVKANAYGHGMITISKILEEYGINDFAVATIEEGITLRKNGLKGNILILGYTDLSKIEDIIKYNLIQTIVDYEYAYKLSTLNLSKKVKVHIKINTGMNRLGESYKNIDSIKKIYKFKNLNILGIYTHLSTPDSLLKEDIKFTQNQINNFYTLINILKTEGYNVGKIHIQSSYGILNYSNLKCDYVRPGIIMYGVCSGNTRIKINLKPVLSLKAKVTSIKYIDKNESVSYGRKYITNKNIKIATVSIGYVDGIPRNLSLKNTKVLINNHYALIIGRICMDQLIIDVSNLNVKVGDVVTLIGDKYYIRANLIAKKAGTIPNELLSRLGNRLEYKIIFK